MQGLSSRTYRSRRTFSSGRKQRRERRDEEEVRGRGGGRGGCGRRLAGRGGGRRQCEEEGCQKKEDENEAKEGAPGGEIRGHGDVEEKCDRNKRWRMRRMREASGGGGRRERRQFKKADKAPNEGGQL